jgi:hypothetical protein
VEWITERPSLSTGPANLTNFISEYISGGYALDNNGAAYTLADSTPIIVVDTNLQPISYPTLLGTNAMWVQDAGSAQTQSQQ